MNQHKRAWIYCRVGHLDTTATILENQKERLLDVAETQGFEIAGITTEVASGRSIKRPGMDEVFSAAKERRMNTLFILDSSRITRDIGEFMDCIKILHEHDIEVLTFNTGVVELTEANSYAEIVKIAESMTD